MAEWVGPDEPFAHLGGLRGTGLRDLTSDLSALDSSGWWAVVVTFEGTAVCARFDDVRAAPLRSSPWRGPARHEWVSSMSREDYVKAVGSIRDRIARGDVYQANLCRVLSAPLRDRCPIEGLAQVLATGNPAPYSGVVEVPGAAVVSASPELFLRRDGRVVESSPIKGTGRTESDLLPKDDAENIMIVDLVRNDLGRVCETGSVSVPELLKVEEHPGLVHLVSTVRGELRTGTGWAELLDATFPPGSVTGAPKSSALRIIRELEPTPRGPYCGAVGFVDADRRKGTLAVGIRSFWEAEGSLHFGTGAGITWGSDPDGEWDETELKAERLVGLASNGS